MSRDHLRLVGGAEPPMPVNLETFSFGRVGGELVILHNDDRVTPVQAMDALVTLVKRDLVPAICDAACPTRRVFPGEMGQGIEVPSDVVMASTDLPAGFTVLPVSFSERVCGPHLVRDAAKDGEG